MKVSAQPVPSISDGGGGDAAFQIEVARYMREVRQDQQQFRDTDLATKSLRMTKQALASIDAQQTQTMMSIATEAIKIVSSGTSLANSQPLGDTMSPAEANKFVDDFASKATPAFEEMTPDEVQKMLDSGALSKEELAFGILDQEAPGPSVFGEAEPYMELGEKANEESLKNQAEAAQKMPKEPAKSAHAEKNMQEIASPLRALLSGLLRG